jgi:hypothetical protein
MSLGKQGSQEISQLPSEKLLQASNFLHQTQKFSKETILRGNYLNP